MKTWFVTGASRGLGAAIVEAALAAGNNVVATARNPEQVADAREAPGRLLRTALDVTDPVQADRVVADATSRFGGIDVLVNNAGYGQIGAFEETSAAEIDRQFAANVFGVFHVTRAILPVMRRRGAGHIFNISSIAGLRGGLYSSAYSASKFAIEGFSEALARELREFQIKVTIVEPGAFRTDFFDASSIRFGSIEIADYAELTRKVVSDLEQRNHHQIGDPARLAAILIDLADSDVPPLRIILGSDAFAAAREKIEALAAGLEAWRDVSLSTDFPASNQAAQP